MSHSRQFLAASRGLAARCSLLLLALLSLQLGTAFAQAPQLILGFAGEIVADTWNPLQLTIRDQRNITLELRIDQGSLRSGPQWISYRAEVPGGPGLHVFEDDVFVPGWNSLIWTVSTGERILASGALGSRERDERPLNLLLSSRPGQYLSLYPAESRMAELTGTKLPRRTAPYSGVNSLLIDGTGTPPAAAAIAAAAVAGTLVLLLEPLPSSHAELLLLAGQAVNPLGAGSIVRGERSFLQQQLHKTEPAASEEQLLQVLSGLNPVTLPTALPLVQLVLALLVYSVLTLLLLRTAGSAGVLTAGGVSLVACLLAWQQLRPDQSSLVSVTTLSITSGGLSRVLSQQTLLELPGGPVTLPGAYRPLERLTYNRTPDSTTLNLRRWQVTPLAGRPELAAAQLSWQDGRVSNDSGHAFQQVLAAGFGNQGSLAADQQLELREGDSAGSELEELFRLLPAGSVLALAGTNLQLLLPDVPAPLSGGMR